MVDEQTRDCCADLDDLTVTRVQRLLSSSEQMNKMADEQCYSRVDVMSRDDEQRWWRADEHELRQWPQIKEASDWWVDVTVSFDCKCKFVLLLRLGYLKPFLAGSKKTRQGPGWRVGALCISRCWFYLTVVAGPKLIQKDYKIIWCCVLLGYGSWWFKCLWYVNDKVKAIYEMIMILVE